MRISVQGATLSWVIMGVESQTFFKRSFSLLGKLRSSSKSQDKISENTFMKESLEDLKLQIRRTSPTKVKKRSEIPTFFP
jgi:hypothetical protein